MNQSKKPLPEISSVAVRPTQLMSTCPVQRRSRQAETQEEEQAREPRLSSCAIEGASFIQECPIPREASSFPEGRRSQGSRLGLSFPEKHYYASFAL